MTAQTKQAVSGSSAASRPVLRQTVTGARRLSNYFWGVVVLGGGLGFLLAGISSYTQVNLLPFANPTQLIFVPQGIVMGFYGIAALLLSTYLWLLIAWDVGGGYNEFSRQTQKATIFRWGFPGENRKLDLAYDLTDIQAIKIKIKEGINPQRALYLKLKNRGDMPLTRVGQPINLADLENQGAELARFLGVPLEGI
jgi:hypothetical protein